MRKFVILSLFLGVSIASYGQGFKAFAYVSIIQTGQIAQTTEINPPTLRGCLPLTISFSGFGRTVLGYNVAPTPCTNFDFYPENTLLNVKNNYLTNKLSYTYNTSGLYNVTVNAACNGNSNYTNKTLLNVNVLNVTNTPLFTLTGCKDNLANVSIQKEYDTYTIDFGDGITTTTNASFVAHTYAVSGTKSVSLIGNYSNTGSQSCQSTPITKSITVYPALTKPNIRQIEVLNQSLNGSAILTIATDANLKYKVEAKPFGGTFTEKLIINSIGGTNTFTLTGLNTLNTVNIIQAYAFDDCGNTTIADEINTTYIKIAADVTGNSVNWNKYLSAAAAEYRLNRPVTTIYSNVENGTANTISELNYKDENVQCGQNYCYTMVENLFSQSKISISAQSCVVAIKPVTISGVTGFNSTFADNSTITLYWDPSTATGVSYVIRGSDNNGYSTQLKETTLLGLAGMDKSYTCFTIKPRLSCSPENPETKTCPIQLSGNTVGTGPASTENQLYWTKYVNGDNEALISQEMEWFSETNTPLGSGSGNLQFLHSTIDEDNQKVKYRVKGTLPNGKITYSNYKDIIQYIRLWVSTAFTPGGANPIFFPKGLFWKDFNMSIFNRWGERVYNTSDPLKGWDGGSYTPGLYSFSVTVTDFYGESIRQTGTFSMIR